MAFTKEPPFDVRVVCSCFAGPLLGALFYLQDQWWWWPVIDREPVLATLKRRSLQGGSFLAVRDGEVSQADADALGFTGTRRTTTMTAEDALRHKTGPLHSRPTTKGWLRKCPACGQVPKISRRDLYTKADAARAEGEPTITVPV